MKPATYRCFTFLLLATACTVKKAPPFFSGEIIYHYTYSSSTLNADSLKAARPTTSAFRYDENNYQSRFMGNDTATYYYNGLTGKCASFSGSKYECEDYTRVTDTILNYRVYDTSMQILGYDCRVLEIQKKHSWLRYFVSTRLKLAPNTYLRHRSYNWDEYGKYAGGGLILASEHRFKHFTMQGTATMVRPHGKNFTALEINAAKMIELCK